MINIIENNIKAINDNNKSITFEVPSRGFYHRFFVMILLFSSIFCVPIAIINHFQGNHISEISLLLYIIIGINIYMSLIKQYKFLNKIKFYESYFVIQYQYYSVLHEIEVAYKGSSVFIFYAHPRIQNTNYLIIKVDGKRIIKQYRDFGWSNKIFDEIVEVYNLYKDKK